MSSSKEPVCHKLIELRNRLNRLQESWDASRVVPNNLGRTSFPKEWQERWSRIVGLLREIEQMLNRSRPVSPWDKSQPAILRFPPLEEGVVSMGMF